MEKANELFQQVNKKNEHLSRLDTSIAQKSLFGIVMFIVGFLG